MGSVPCANDPRSSLATDDDGTNNQPPRLVAVDRLDRFGGDAIRCTSDYFESGEVETALGRGPIFGRAHEPIQHRTWLISRGPRSLGVLACPRPPIGGAPIGRGRGEVRKIRLARCRGLLQTILRETWPRRRFVTLTFGCFD